MPTVFFLTQYRLGDCISSTVVISYFKSQGFKAVVFCNYRWLSLFSEAREIDELHISFDAEKVISKQYQEGDIIACASYDWYKKLEPALRHLSPKFVCPLTPLHGNPQEPQCEYDAYLDRKTQGKRTTHAQLCLIRTGIDPDVDHRTFVGFSPRKEVPVSDVLVHMGSLYRHRRLPIPFVKSLLDKLPGRVLCLSDEQHIKRLRSNGVLCESTDFETMISLVAKTRLLITADSGPLHIRHALRSPMITVDLGITNPIPEIIGGYPGLTNFDYDLCGDPDHQADQVAELATHKLMKLSVPEFPNIDPQEARPHYSYNCFHGKFARVTGIWKNQYFAVRPECIVPDHPESKIVNYSSQNIDCIGEMVNAPAQYLHTPVWLRMIVRGYRPDELQKHAIIGGANLDDANCKSINRLMSVWTNRLIGWSIDYDQSRSLDLDLCRFDLVGIMRDHCAGYDWVPPVSCMSSLFDRPQRITNEFVVFMGLNSHKPIPLQKQVPTVSGLDRFDECVDCLSTADTVLTNSYHGMYWSLLLGKKVIVFPSYENLNFKYKVAMCTDPESWKSCLSQRVDHPEALQECREANIHFAAKVSDVLGFELKFQN